MAAIHSWGEEHQLVDLGRAVCQVLFQPPELLQGGMQLSYQRKLFDIHIAQGFLHVSEQASVTREGEHYGLEILKDLVPEFDIDLPLVGGG